LGASRDKKINYGNKDFWVVKFGNPEMNKKQRVTIEAYPNPTSRFVNIIIGFEYERGTIGVYNMGGQEIQRLTVNDQTIPIDLGNIPSGIYIISLTTNRGNESIKIIKNE
jgi:hypothetical protein